MSNLENISNSSTVSRRGAMSLRGGVKTRGGRLPPLRMRELPASQSTGKRGIAPKIPARRIKKEPGEPEVVVKKEFDTNRSERRPRGERGRGRGRREYIQLEGSTFCDGPAAREKAIRHADRERLPREAGVARTKTKKEIEDETERFKALLSTYGVDEDLLEDENKILPVRLPFPRTQIKKEIKEELDVDIKTVIKKEIIEEEKTEDKKPGPLEGKFFTRIKTEDFKELQKDNDLIRYLEKTKELEANASETQLPILIQFPNNLPFTKAKPTDDESNANNSSASKKEASKKSKSDEDSEEKTDDTKGCSLGNMQEGYIGKLQILKSGRMRLVLGSVSLSFEPGSRPAFSQELLSVRCQDEGGDMTYLGDVRSRFLCHPFMGNLIVDARAGDCVLEDVVKKVV